VVVIGGGPAGAIAARCLASWGRAVLLLSRRTAGPALAESLPPSCLALFDRIGIRQGVEEAGFMRATGNAVWWGNEPARVERFASGSSGFQVARDRFDRLLLEQAAAAGAIVRRRALVRDVLAPEDATGMTLVRFETGAQTRDVAARWVLDCSGRSGLVARRRWRRPQPASRTLALIGVWEASDGWDLEDDSHTLVESYEGGWAWSVPVAPTQRYFTIMVDPAITAFAGRKQLSPTYRSELAKTRHLKRFVERATLAGSPWARDASPYLSSRVSDDGMLVVGDAASFVDPLSSFGVKKALASAWLASVVTHTSLSDSRMQRPALDLYERRERAMHDTLASRSAALAREAAVAHETSFWSTRAMADTPDAEDETDVTALRQDPDVLAAFAEIRRRPSVQFQRTVAVQEVKRPTVRGNQVVLEPHLVAPAFAEGVRYLRNVDLVTLAGLACAHEQVPDLYDAYNRAASPASLPDFLGALSVLVGKRMLTFI
jgi:flavin-dependent dehydrogenase